MYGKAEARRQVESNGSTEAEFFQNPVQEPHLIAERGWDSWK
jgi:hypothetical protein